MNTTNPSALGAIVAVFGDVRPGRAAWATWDMPAPFLARQRMDFLLLFSDRQRMVSEVDGKQHYAHGDQASPVLYSEMVAEDRLRLAGYEVYRFGGYELAQKQNSVAMVEVAPRARP